MHRYFPDVWLESQTLDGIKTFLIEIKPKSQTTLEHAGRSKINKVHAIVNDAKWKAAAIWAKNNNITFRILTEDDIFKTNK